MSTITDQFSVNRYKNYQSIKIKFSDEIRVPIFIDHLHVNLLARLHIDYIYFV